MQAQLKPQSQLTNRMPARAAEASQETGSRCAVYEMLPTQAFDQAMNR